MVKIITFLLLVIIYISSLTLALKCTSCNNCTTAESIECNGVWAEETKRIVRPFIPAASEQPITNEYVCLTMKGSSGDHNVLDLRGCSYSIVNYCNSPNTIFNGAVSCAWCSVDGCNNSGMSLNSTTQFIVLLISFIVAIS